MAKTTPTDCNARFEMTSVNQLIQQKSPYVSVSVAATSYLFKPVETVRRWCREKDKTEFRNARKMGRDWQIPRADLMIFVARSLKQQN